jgi:hypothetical protein
MSARPIIPFALLAAGAVLAFAFWRQPTSLPGDEPILELGRTDEGPPASPVAITPQFPVTATAAEVAKTSTNVDTAFDDTETTRP